MADETDKWARPAAPPPPLFLGEKERDLVKQIFYEIVSLKEAKELFGQADRRIEISAQCIRSREGLFDGT